MAKYIAYPITKTPKSYFKLRNDTIIHYISMTRVAASIATTRDGEKEKYGLSCSTRIDL